MILTCHQYLRCPRFAAGAGVPGPGVSDVTDNNNYSDMGNVSVSNITDISDITGANGFRVCTWDPPEVSRTGETSGTGAPR